jgi:hypothetical protein
LNAKIHHLNQRHIYLTKFLVRLRQRQSTLLGNRQMVHDFITHLTLQPNVEHHCRLKHSVMGDNQIVHNLNFDSQTNDAQTQDVRPFEPGTVVVLEKFYFGFIVTHSSEHQNRFDAVHLGQCDVGFLDDVHLILDYWKYVTIISYQ